MTIKEPCGFADRLDWILAGRRPSPWAISLGLSKTMVSRIAQGHVPGIDALQLIAEAENVSLDWLVRGRGPAYLMTRCVTNGQVFQAINDLHGDLPDTARCFHIPLHAEGTGLIIAVDVPPADDDAPSYSGVHVIYGPFDLEGLIDLQEIGPEIEIDADIQYAIAAGRIGGYRLVGTPDCPGPVPVFGEWDGAADMDGPARREPLAAMFRRLEGESPEKARIALSRLVVDALCHVPPDAAASTPARREVV